MQVSSETKSDRQKILSDPKTRELLRRLILGGKPLAPEVGTDGLVHYLVAEAVIGDVHATEAWIDHLLGSGMLNKSSFRDLVTCPTHFRVDPLIELECLKCKTRKLRKTTLVEHLQCGYIDTDLKFNKDGFLVCPNCKRPIQKSGELRSTGVWYECEACLTKTNLPKVVFSCRKGHEFSSSDLSLAPVYTYAVEEAVVAQLRNTLVLAPALNVLLTALGYAVTSPATLQGRSGTNHTVDVYASKGVDDPNVAVMDIAIQIAVDIVPVEPSAVISFFAKTYDLKPKLSILIAIPSASQSAKQINEGYGITIVEDADGSGAVQKVGVLLESPSQDQ
jgi:Thaumarchaeal output domain 1